jgi:hypothetical protein
MVSSWGSLQAGSVHFGGIQACWLQSSLRGRVIIVFLSLENISNFLKRCTFTTSVHPLPKNSMASLQIVIDLALAFSRMQMLDIALPVL